MTEPNPIVGITLEGFQVFEKPTYIPLERLTLIFGPNSAGKSAIQDAFEVVSVLMVPKKRSLETLYKIRELMERHWRRNGDSGVGFVDSLSIAVKHTTSCSVDEAVADDLGREFTGNPYYVGRSGTLLLENRWTFQRELDDAEDEILDFRWDFEFLIESELFVSSIGTNRILTVNLNHPILRGIEKRVGFGDVAKTYPDLVTFENGKITVRQIEGFDSSGADFDMLSPSYGNPEIRSPLFLAAIAELSLLVGKVLTVSQGNSNFRPFKVDATRSVPTRRELTFQIGDLDDPMQMAIDHEEDLLCKALAASLTSELTTHLSKHKTLAERKQFADSVNRALTDHLFIEQGYRLDYDFRLLMSKENSQAAINEVALDPDEFAFLVELFLRDSKGRKHLFADVGSGIGYLLPVLCAVYGLPSLRFVKEFRFSAPTICFFQQPELHIHPALQAALGDIFIESRVEGQQVLVETHSEHLLLRILKRIRQTHLHVNIAPELKITADDVCVLYFDPSPDDTTTVKRLRITEDGEFMDRWPRGFFGERDQELLDE